MLIFVTVGTHEQPFNRLIKAVDDLRAAGSISEPVILQTGFSTYEPKHCEWHKFLPYSEMKSNMERARIIISHGGPASFLMPLQFGKIPIVVPREEKFHEHVNNHQVDFAHEVSTRMGIIIPVYDVADLANTIRSYDQTLASLQHSIVTSNTVRFNDRLQRITEELFTNQHGGKLHD